jgi:hypothetical protein
MKRIALVFITMILLVSVNAFAASSIVAATGTRGGVYFEAPDGTMVVLKLTCTAHTDGTFDNKLLDSSVITALTKFGSYYYQSGYYLAHAWVVNDSTDNHASGAVTVTDATTQQLIGTSAGDTLTLSTSASGIAYLSSARSAAQRAVTSELTVAISDTGAAATVQTLYLLLVR